MSRYDEKPGSRKPKRLDDASAERLAKILGMLGSSHDGERAAAALKAHEMVRAAGLTWRDVIMPSPSIAPQLEGSASWRFLAAECMPFSDRLPPREVEFVSKILTYRREPSPKQMKWLTDIHARLHSGTSAHA
jgi:hypothetical protein